MMYIQIHFILRLKLRILPDAHNGPHYTRRTYVINRHGDRVLTCMLLCARIGFRKRGQEINTVTKGLRICVGFYRYPT